MSAVTIVGRKNVGKSTIFNRLTGGRYSIVHKDPGVTRDRVYGEVEWRGRSFDLIDTGGFFPDEEHLLAASIQKQIDNALHEADLIYLVVDGRTGLKPVDEEISARLRKTGKPVLVLVNKIDDNRITDNAAEFHRLGYDAIFSVSAEAGRGFGDVLDATLEYIPVKRIVRPASLLRLLIVGRPNSGKSTLLNAFLKEDRAIVDAQPGTTRDLVNARIEYKGTKIEIIDTAGIRKRSRISEPIEFYSVMRAIRMIERTDITILIFDVGTGTVLQDQRIASLVLSKAKGLVIAANKIDLIEKKNQDRIVPSTLRSLPFLDFVPVIPISAKTGVNIDTLMDQVLAVHRESSKSVTQRVLDDMAETLKPPPNGEVLRVRQIGRRPPVFQAVITSSVKESYIKYLRNTLRHYLGYSGIPILIRTEVKGSRPGRRKQ